MVSSSVARRWARALLSLGVEQGRFEAWADELERVWQAREASPELRALWADPVARREDRLASVDALAKALSLSEPVANTLRLLVERRRLDQLEAIVRAYRDLVDEKAGRVRGTVTSARPLAPEAVERIARALSAATGRQVALQTKTDPALLGGVVAQLGGTVLDGSLATQLETLRRSLRRAPVAQ